MGLVDEPSDFAKVLLEASIRNQLGIPSDESLDQAGQADHYDYNGFIKAALAGEPIAQTMINPSDGKIHFPDPWKAEDHPTHLWKTIEDYGVQAKYSPLTDQAYQNSFSAMSQDSPVWQRMIQYEQQIPDYGVGGNDSQRLFTNYLYQLAKKA